MEEVQALYIVLTFLDCDVLFAHKIQCYLSLWVEERILVIAFFW